jgi:hypothetical protein
MRLHGMLDGLKVDGVVRYQGSQHSVRHSKPTP